MPRAEGGQATVELALCLPIAAAILAALVEIGLLAGDQVRLWHAAREAARAAVVDPAPQSARWAAERSGLEPLAVNVSPSPPYRVQGEPLTVSLTYNPPGRVPIIGDLIARLDLEATATMRIEQP